jgi:hypothetical protein
MAEMPPARAIAATASFLSSPTCRAPVKAGRMSFTFSLLFSTFSLSIVALIFSSGDVMACVLCWLLALFSIYQEPISKEWALPYLVDVVNNFESILSYSPSLSQCNKA